MNNPFEYVPDRECDEAFRKLSVRIDELKRSERPEDVGFCKELEAGKMLGVLIAVDSNGNRHTLYAFSGQLGETGFSFPGFVGPVFDYLQPDGYFKTNEAHISRQNIEIAQFEADVLNRLQADYKQLKEKTDIEIAAFREKCRLSTSARKAKRESGVTDEAELAEMTRQSQFEKAELNRLKKRIALKLAPLAEDLKKGEAHLEELKEERRACSENLQNWLFTNFKVLNSLGESKNLSDIFAETAMRIPPSGAGECCAPKLLQAAYMQGWHPEAIAEYWYGQPKGGEVRKHGNHYPACRGKCLPVLSWMLKGLTVEPALNCENMSALHPEPEVIYENEWFCVVNKPSGMLSVPGKGAALSVQQWLEKRYGTESGVRMAHRLDQDTSGLIIATFGSFPLKTMQALFATRGVRKTYIAELDGDFEARGTPRKGQIKLPLSPDWLDRPRQRVDYEAGKEAVTDYEFLIIRDGRSRIMFHPLTGRTHQLRVHAASENGLSMPIAGDRLYGNRQHNDNSRLLLHAQKIEFTFPMDERHYCFESEPPF